MNARTMITLGGSIGAIGVAAGALGAHGLEKVLLPEQMETYQVAVRYQLLHAVALVLIGLIARDGSTKATGLAAWSFLIGVLLFSGCIYGYLATDFGPLIHLVPIGGVAFIVGWIALAVAA